MTPRAFRTATFAAACLLAAATPTSAAVLTASEDNFVLKSAPTTPQANGTTFPIKEATTGQGNARLAYLKFDLTGLTPAADGNFAEFTAVTSAAAPAGFTLRAYALKAGVTGFDWTEAAITYNNRPAFNNTSNPLVNTAQVTQVGSNFVVANGSAIDTPSTFSFSGWDAFRQADNSLTLILLALSQTDAGPFLTFHSSEATTASVRPMLEITAVPEPAAALLLAAAAPLFLRRRRR